MRRDLLQPHSVVDRPSWLNIKRLTLLYLFLNHIGMNKSVVVLAEKTRLKNQVLNTVSMTKNMIILVTILADIVSRTL